MGLLCPFCCVEIAGNGFLNLGSETAFAKIVENAFTVNYERFQEGTHDGKGFSPLETVFMLMALLVRSVFCGK